MNDQDRISETVNETQEQELRSLKRAFPFRIVYGALKNGEFRTGAVYTKHAPNRLARSGWTVWLL